MKKILLLAFCLVFLASANLFAQSTAKIAMEVETSYQSDYNADTIQTSIGADTYFYVCFYIKDYANCKGFDLRFTFDNTLLEYVSSSKDKDFDFNFLGTSASFIGQLSSGKDNEVTHAYVVDGADKTSSSWGFAGYAIMKTKSTFTTSTEAYLVFNFAQIMDVSDNNVYVSLGNEQNAAINATETQASTTLPVELVDFTADAGANFVTLNWTTASELNNFGFEVLKSVDGVNFSKVGFVNGNGTTDAEIDYTYADEGLAAGTYYYKLKQIDYDGNYEYSGVVEAVVTAGGFNLSQNYPNPFNPTTSISFDIPSKAHVELLITNTLGQVVETLVSREMVPGHHSVTFDAGKLSSGTYFYTLKAGNQVMTKTLTVIK